MKTKKFLKVPVDPTKIFSPEFGSPIPHRKRRPRNGAFKKSLKRASIIVTPKGRIRREFADTYFAGKALKAVASAGIRVSPRKAA